MRSQKPYTNATFTKRVDHEAGRHRTLRSVPEPKLCQECGAIYSTRRWRVLTQDQIKEEFQEKTFSKTLCPACKQLQNGVPGGFVHLEGTFLVDHKKEIEHMMRNVAMYALNTNPLARIMNWETPNANSLKVATTTEKLAQRLGHELNKAFGGTVRYDFSHENKLVHVWWHRD